MSESKNLRDMRRLVDNHFSREESSHLGALTRLDEGQEILPEVLFQFMMMQNRSDQQSLLQIYRGLGQVGEELWSQEARALLRLSNLQHPALPKVKEGNILEEDKLGYVITEAAEYTLASGNAMAVLSRNRMDALSQLTALADALFEMHSRGMMHRNIWPGAIEVAQVPDSNGAGMRLRLARFEMSTLISNLLRPVKANHHQMVSSLRSLYLHQGPLAIACFPPERLGFLYEEQQQDMLEDGRSDIYSLGIIAYQWFIAPLPEPELRCIFRADGYEKDALRKLHQRMRADIGRSGEPRILCDLLERMISENRRNRPTSLEVYSELVAHAEGLLNIWRETEAQPTYLLSYSPEDFRETLLAWGWLQADPGTEEGLEELRAYILKDIGGGFLTFSQEGFLPFRHQGDTTTLRKAKYVLVGTSAAYFASEYERHDPFGVIVSAPRITTRALHICFTLRLEGRQYRTLQRKLHKQRLPTELALHRFDSPRFRELRDAPDWAPLIKAVKDDIPVLDWQPSFEAALRWMLDVAQAQYDAKFYAYSIAARPASNRVLLRIDKERDEPRLHNNSLLYVYATSTKNARPSLGDYLEGLDDGEIVLWPDHKGSVDTDRNRMVRASFLKREDADVISVELPRGTSLPDKGWLQPASEMGSAQMLMRQRFAVEELFDNPVLMQQLHRPRTLINLSDPGSEPGREVKGRGRVIVKEMLKTMPFYAVHGPPGTGKTTVTAWAVRLALQSDLSRRILVVAQSHFSLDNMAERIMGLLQAQRPKRSQSGGGAKEAGDIPGEALASSIDVLAIRIASGESLAKVNRQISGLLPSEQAASRVTAIVNRCQQRLKENKDSAPVREIVENWMNHAEESRLEIMDRLRRGANLVFATCGTATRRNLETVGDQELFDWVIVEEAAKAWPTELAIPLVRGIQWTLIGDYQQLGPFGREDMARLLAACADSDNHELKSRVADSEGILRVFSLFANLFAPAKNDQEPAVKTGRLRQPTAMLDTQFRMRSPIGALISEVFYDRALQTVDERREEDHPLAGPSALRNKSLLWLDTSRLPDSREEGRWCNHAEARTVAELVKLLQPSKPAQGGPPRLSQENLAILTPYWDQVDRLKLLVPDCYRESVFTVDSFQGKEADIVIVSLVRHNDRKTAAARLGYLTHRQRINVMFSRARWMLMVIGHYPHFRDSQVSPWKEICARFGGTEEATLGELLDVRAVLGKETGR